MITIATAVTAAIIGLNIGMVTDEAGLNLFTLNEEHGRDAHVETLNQKKGGYDFPSNIVIDGEKVRVLK